MTVLIIEHAPGRADGLVREAEKYQVPYSLWKPYQGEELNNPPMSFDGIIIGGGPMGVYELDKFPFFTHELNIIEAALESKIPTFGVCLGAQILAQMLGCRVERTYWRRGFMYVQPTADSTEDALYNGITEPFPTFQFHQDEILDLPNGSIHTLTSDNCTIEGFRLASSPVWAIQSHPEVSLEKAYAILRSVAKNEDIDIGKLMALSDMPRAECNSRLFANFFKSLSMK